MEITGKVQIQILHRHNLRVSAAGCTSPLIPKHGPRDGSLNAITALFPSLPNASPEADARGGLSLSAGVGLIAVTRISFPVFLSETRRISSSESFGLVLFRTIPDHPSGMSSFAATLANMYHLGFPCAISISLFIMSPPFPPPERLCMFYMNLLQIFLFVLLQTAHGRH